MTNSISKDFRNTHFEYKTLDRIHGKPDITSLLYLFHQIKRNALSVPATLGGGQLGYLTLFLKIAAYNVIPNAHAFFRLVHPGDFIITVPRVLRGDPPPLTV